MHKTLQSRFTVTDRYVRWCTFRGNIAKCKQVFVFWLTFASTQANMWNFSWLWNYVTPGSLSDGGSRFLIHAMAHQKHRSQKCMDVRCTTSVRISEDLIWWRPVILTSWQWQSQLGKSPWTVFYVRTSSLYSMHCLTGSQCSCHRTDVIWFEQQAPDNRHVVAFWSSCYHCHQWCQTAVNYNSPTDTWWMHVYLFYIDRQVKATWSATVNLLSIVTSRLCTVSTTLLLLLVCVSFTIIGQPRNSVLIRRV